MSNQSPSKRSRMRTLWLQIHLWLGITLGVLGAFIGISGSILVFDHEADAVLNPQRYAVSGSEVTLPYSQYIANAQGAVTGKARPVLLRMPAQAGLPVMVSIRERGEGGTSYTAYLDPPSGRVLELAAGGGAIGWVHRFHEFLQLREFYGREVVGAVGFSMLISALSGLYLWWPSRGRFREALGFRRGLPLTRNLHYFFGFYGCLVLAMLSFTGIYLAFPQASRSVVRTFTAVSPLTRNVQGSEATEGSKPIAVDQAITAAQALYPAEKLWSVAFPAGPRGSYRINLSEPGVAEAQPGRGNIVFVDANSGTILKQVDAAQRSGGDNFIITQRGLHSGAALGFAARVIICIAGLLPALFVVTGTIMWLRQRRRSHLRSA